MSGGELDGIDHTAEAADLQRFLGVLEEPNPTFAIVTP